MPASTEPRSGLQYGWSLGEDGWNIGMDANLLAIGRFGMHLSVKDRNVVDPSLLTPANGDTYIVGPAAIGAWAGQVNNIAIWDGAAWVFATPRTGWIAYVEDETLITVYQGAGWNATGIAFV